MDRATWIERVFRPAMADAGAVLLRALDRDGLNVLAAFWRLDEEALQWDYYIVTPEVDEMDPRLVTRRVWRVLAELSPMDGLPGDLATCVTDPNDHRFLNLRQYSPVSRQRKPKRHDHEGWLGQHAYVYRMT